MRTVPRTDLVQTTTVHESTVESLMSEAENQSAEVPFVTVARVGDIAEGKSDAFPVNGRMVAVFCHGGDYFAIDDFCPHMGASLAGGQVDSGYVACPWHAWCFSLKDGTWTDNPKIKVDCFETRVKDDEIQVRVAPKEVSS